ncbi:flocculation protein FLO11-like [Stegastes partitus]|uniref:Flocculation protein FLO11-like n=1 Tax=Stegastes partitus TaxID=144197 RepID=A0A9Y4KEE3_9TELE|nr:PREDICTED: flocculation protein FLO11-like [Stegastes partitus]
MMKLLLGVFLGLLAVVQSTPITSETHIPVEPVAEFFREVLGDGFLVPSLTTETAKTQSTLEASQQTSTESSPTTAQEDVSRDSVLLFHSTQSPQTNETAQESQQTYSNESDEVEGSAAGVIFWHVVDDYTTTTQSSASTQETEGSTEFDAAELPTVSTTMEASQWGLFDTMEGSALGQIEDMFPTSSWHESSTAIPSTTEASTDSPTSVLSPGFGHVDEELITITISDSLGSDSGSGMFVELTQNVQNHGRLFSNETPEKINSPIPDPEQHKGHSTPGWIIIVGFIVGVAALVMLCVAIATRDKWNGPRQASTANTEPNPSNQQRAVEMETFLRKDEPRENGKAAEYTVIPLDELSESYS